MPGCHECHPADEQNSGGRPPTREDCYPFDEHGDQFISGGYADPAQQGSIEYQGLSFPGPGDRFVRFAGIERRDSSILAGEPCPVTSCGFPNHIDRILAVLVVTAKKRLAFASLFAVS